MRSILVLASIERGVELTLEGLGHGGSSVFVGVESSEASHGEELGNTDHGLLLGVVLRIHEPIVRLEVVEPVVAALTSAALLHLVVLEFIRHGRQSDALRQVG